LNISHGDASIESCRDECVPERVRPDGLADPGPGSDLSDDPGGAVPVQSLPAGPGRPAHWGRWPMARSMARAVRGASGMVTILPPLRVMVSPVPAPHAEGLDVRTGGLRHPQPVQGEQGDQRVLGGLAQARRDQQATEVVAVQPPRVRLVVQPRAADMSGR